MQIYQYGDKEINYLKSRDKALGEMIDRIGLIEREIIPDLFTALVYSIVGQQISMKACNTVWTRMTENMDKVTPEAIVEFEIEEIQSFGMTMKKASYIKGVAESVINGELNINELYSLSDEEVCRELVKLKGIGTWTAEMLMIFSMGRHNIVSFDDLAIQRGMRLLYRHRRIDKQLFLKYKRRYSPYGTVASLYLWEIACRDLGLKDPSNIKRAEKKKRV